MPCCNLKLHKGTIVYVDMNPVKGKEVLGKRHAVVFERFPGVGGTVTILPLTSKAPPKPFPFLAHIPKGVAGLAKDSWVKCEQIRTVSLSQVGKIIGKLPPKYISSVTEALKYHLGLD